MGHLIKIGGSGLTNVQVGSQSGDTGDILNISDEDYAKISATALDGDPLIDLGEEREGASVITIPANLATIPAGAGDVVTNLPLEGEGTIVSVAFVATEVGAGAGATRAFNLEINATNLTGGVVTATLASTDTVGKVTNGTAITGNNAFHDGDTLSIEVAAGTVFTGGRGFFVVTVT